MPDSAPLRETVAMRMKEAMKGGDKVRVGALRLIMAALKEREIEARGAGKIVSRADPRKQPVDNADPGAACRHITSDLGQERNQRILAQEGRFARHVRARDQPNLAGLLPGRGREIAIVGDKGGSVAFQRLFDDRMPAALDGKVERGIDLGPDVIVVDRKPCQCGRNIEPRKAVRGGAQVVTRRKRLRREAFEDFEFKIECTLAGVRNPGLGLAKLRRREAHLSRQRLAMDEDGIERRRHQLVAVLGCDFHEIAEHIVVPDFQRLDLGLLGIAGLERGNDAARFIAQRARLVERGVIVRADEAPIALDQLGAAEVVGRDDAPEVLGIGAESRAPSSQQGR